MELQRHLLEAVTSNTPVFLILEKTGKNKFITMIDFDLKILQILLHIYM